MDILPILVALKRQKTAALLITLEIALCCAILCNALFLIVTRLERSNIDSGLAESQILRIQSAGLGRDDDASVRGKTDSVWSADFMSDALLNGRRFRTFNVVDDFNREALQIEIDTSITSERLVRIFERLQSERGLPQVLRTDNGPEFLGEAFTSWAKNAGMAIQYIQPGKPNQNAYIERFNRTYRDEVLDQHLFTCLDDVREATYWWMIEYNEERPHDSLGDLTPLEARQQVAGISTNELST